MGDRSLRIVFELAGADHRPALIYEVRLSSKSLDDAAAFASRMGLEAVQFAEIEWERRKIGS